jgi:hypothetical protein
VLVSRTGPSAGGLFAGRAPDPVLTSTRVRLRARGCAGARRGDGGDALLPGGSRTRIGAGPDDRLSRGGGRPGRGGGEGRRAGLIGNQGWQGRSRGADQRPAPPHGGASFWRPAPRAPRPGRSFLAPRAPRPSYGALIFGAPRPGRPGAPANPVGNPYRDRAVWLVAGPSLLRPTRTVSAQAFRRLQHLFPVHCRQLLSECSWLICSNAALVIMAVLYQDQEGLHNSLEMMAARLL